MNRIEADLQWKRRLNIERRTLFEQDQMVGKFNSVKRMARSKNYRDQELLNTSNDLHVAMPRDPALKTADPLGKRRYIRYSSPLTGPLHVLVEKKRTKPIELIES